MAWHAAGALPRCGALGPAARREEAWKGRISSQIGSFWFGFFGFQGAKFAQFDEAAQAASWSLHTLLRGT